MMARNRARSESRFQRWRFRGAISPGAMPQGWNENSALGAKQIFLSSRTRRFAGQSMIQPRLHYVNVDLGDVVLLQARSHFCLQLPWVNSARDIEQKHHLSLVFIERGTLQPTLVRHEQRLHRAKHWLRILSVVESNSDPAARVRIKPVDEYPAEGGNKYGHCPRSHAARKSDYHDHDCFPGKFRIIEHGPKSKQRANAEDNKRERLTGPA